MQEWSDYGSKQQDITSNYVDSDCVLLAYCTNYLVKYNSDCLLIERLCEPAEKTHYYHYSNKELVISEWYTSEEGDTLYAYYLYLFGDFYSSDVLTEFLKRNLITQQDFDELSFTIDKHVRLSFNPTGFLQKYPQ